MISCYPNNFVRSCIAEGIAGITERIAGGVLRGNFLLR